MATKKAAAAKKVADKRSAPRTVAKKSAAKSAAHVKKAALAAETTPQINRVMNAEPVSALAPTNTPAIQLPSREPKTAEQLRNESVTRVAREVISGQWNNEAGRDERLLAEGHDPELVNTEVARLRAAH